MKKKQNLCKYIFTLIFSLCLLTGCASVSYVGSDYNKENVRNVQTREDFYFSTYKKTSQKENIDMSVGLGKTPLMEVLVFYVAITNKSATPYATYLKDYLITNSKGNLFRTLKKADSIALAKIENFAVAASKVDEWGFAEVSKEEYLNWKPDFIFLDEPLSENSISKQILLNDSTYKFSSAVRDNKIFVTHPFSCPKDYVFVVAEAYYYARIAYPQLLSEEDYKSTINSIFDKAYGLKNYYEEWEKSHN